MVIPRQLCEFKVSIEDLINIYILYIRAVAEQPCVVWAYSINEEEKFRLENPENCIDNYFKRKIYNILN